MFNSDFFFLVQITLQEKRHNTTNIIAKKKKCNIYTITFLGCFFCCNSNLNLLHQYEIIAIIIMLH